MEIGCRPDTLGLLPGGKGQGRDQMTRVLQSERREPLSGTTKSVVVFLHGYGANGADLLGLADPLGEHMPDTLFVAPDAPESIPGMPFGLQWFPIPWIDGSSEEEAERGLNAAAEDLNAFLDALMVDEDVLPEQVVLFGFSQGTMMSLYVAPRREKQIAGIVGFSGRLIPGDDLSNVPSKPPVLLVHGDQDEMINVSEMSSAETALRAAGFDVSSHISRGIGHGIAPDGLTLGLQFLMKHLGYPS